MTLKTVELPANTAIHYSGLEGGVSFLCGKERIQGEYWSQYTFHVSCDACLNKLRARGELSDIQGSPK